MFDLNSNDWSFRNMFTPIGGQRNLSIHSDFFAPSLWSNNPSIDDAPKTHSWTYSAIRARGVGVSSIPVRVYEGKREDKKAVSEDHELQRVFGAPNPAYSEAVMWQIVMGLLDTKGYAMIVVDPFIGMEYRQGVPREMWALDCDYFKAMVQVGDKEIPTEPGKGLFKRRHQIQRWQHNIYADMTFTGQQVIYFELPEGAPLTAARISIEGDAAAGNFSRKFAQNDMVPSGWFSFDKQLRPEQYDQFKSRLQRDHQGSDNAGQFMLLDMGMVWNPNALTHRDMQWMEGRQYWRDEIKSIFGVNDAVLNIGADAKYSNHLAEQRTFMEMTVFPLQRGIVDTLWAQLLQHIDGGRYWIEFDSSGHPAMQSDIADRLSHGETAVRMGFPLNQVNARFNLGFEEVEGGDVGLVSATLIPMGQTYAVEGEELEPAKDDGTLTTEQAKDILAVVAQVQMGTLPPESAKTALSLAYKLTPKQINELIDPADAAEEIQEESKPSDEQEQGQSDNGDGESESSDGGRGLLARHPDRRFLLSVINRRADYRRRAYAKAKKQWRHFLTKTVRSRQKKFTSRYNKLLMDQRKETMASLTKLINGKEGRSRRLLWNEPCGRVGRDGKRAPTALSADDVLQIGFDEQKWNDSLSRLFEPMYRDMILETGRNTIEMLGSDLVFDAFNPRWTQIINERIGDELTRANQNTIDAVRRAMRKALSDGDTPTQMMERLRQLPEFTRARARTVAVTEMGSVVNQTRNEQYVQYGIDQVVWITSGSDRVRDSHAECEAHGAITRGEVFPNGLRFPHEPGGEAAEVINCECALMAAVE